MFTSILCTLWACTQLAMIAHSRSELVCVNDPSSAIQLSLRSLRSENSRVLSLDMEREASKLRDNLKTDQWAVDLKSDVRTCETRGNILHVTLTLTHNFPGLYNNNVTNKAVGKPFRPDYELFQGIGYYKFHDIAKDWETARQTCVDEGAHLIIINSEKEVEVIQELHKQYPKITEASNPYFSWIGAERKSGEYFSIDGTPMNNTGYAKWRLDNPYKNEKWNCLFVHKSVDGLANFPCDKKHAFVCEKDI